MEKIFHGGQRRHNAETPQLPHPPIRDATMRAIWKSLFKSGLVTIPGKKLPPSPNDLAISPQLLFLWQQESAGEIFPFMKTLVQRRFQRLPDRKEFDLAVNNDNFVKLERVEQ